MGRVLFKDQLGEELVLDLSEVVAAKLNRNLKSITFYFKGTPKDSSFTVVFPSLEEAENFWNTEVVSNVIVHFEVESAE